MFEKFFQEITLQGGKFKGGKACIQRVTPMKVYVKLQGSGKIKRVSKKSVGFEMWNGENLCRFSTRIKKLMPLGKSSKYTSFKWEKYNVIEEMDGNDLLPRTSNKAQTIVKPLEFVLDSDAIFYFDCLCLSPISKY